MLFHYILISHSYKQKSDYYSFHRQLNNYSLIYVIHPEFLRNRISSYRDFDFWVPLALTEEVWVLAHYSVRSLICPQTLYFVLSEFNKMVISPSTNCSRVFEGTSNSTSYLGGRSDTPRSYYSRARKNTNSLQK